MSVFTKASLGQKLYASFAAVLLLVAISGAVAVVELGSVSSAAKRLYGLNLVAGQLASAVETEALVVRTKGLSYVLEPSAKERATDRVAIADSQRTIGADLSALEAMHGLTAQQRALVGEVATKLNEWYAARDKGPIALTDAGEHAAATQAILHGVTGKKFKAAFAAVQTFGSITSRDAARSSASAQSTARSAKLIEVGLIAAAALLAIALAFLLTRSIKRGVAPVLDRLRMLQEHCTTDLERGLERMARGDLTFEVTPVTPPIEKFGGDELGRVAMAVNGIRERTIGSVEAYNQTRAALADLISQVQSASGTVSAASGQMASTSAEAGRAVGEIANAVGDVATGAERQVKMVEEARHSAEETAAQAVAARDVAIEGVSVAQQASQAMEAVRDASGGVTDAIQSLAQKSDEIGGIVETITGIASQTNLLALNAAIEAARAGDQGRGFAVVAEEVRKLAEESQEAATKIAELIHEIRTETERTVAVVEDGARRTEEGVDVVARARDAFVQIGERVEEVNGRIGAIVSSTGDIAAVAEQSSASTEQVSASTQQTSASTQEIAASAQQLATTAEDLRQLVDRFKLAA